MRDRWRRDQLQFSARAYATLAALMIVMAVVALVRNSDSGVALVLAFAAFGFSVWAHKDHVEAHR